MECFKLEIIRPTETKTISIFWIDVEGITGDFVVGADHYPLVSILKPRGCLTYKTEDKLEVKLDVYWGIIIVDQNKAKVILDN